MPGIGLGLQIWNTLNGGVSYAANGIAPPFVADFSRDSYQVDSSATTFASAYDTPTRSGLGTMVDSDGNLKWGAYNLLTYSEQFDNAAWLKGSGGTGSTPVVTANDTTAPDGTLTADLVVFDLNGGTASADISWLTQAVTTTAVNHNIKVWGKSTSGTVTFILDYDSGVDTVTVGEEWTLLNHEDVSNGGSGQVRIGLRGSFGTSDSASVHLWGAHLYRSDLGGMVNNPDRGDSYVPTVASAVYLPRRKDYLYDSGALTGLFYQHENEARTNLFLNSDTPSTQGVTTTAQPYTVHFTGTGTITFSGAHTGSLVGTGTGEENRVSTTFTPSAGTVTCTVTGTVTNAQFEAGSTPSSYYPTAGASQTRLADALIAPDANMPWGGSGASGSHSVRLTYADEGTAAQETIFDWRADASNRITLTLDTDGAKTGTLTLTVVNGGTSLSTSAATELTPGINKAARVAWWVDGSNMNIALNGTAETQTASPGLPDLSTADGNFGGIMGYRAEDLIWGVKIDNAGIEQASA